MNEKKSKGFGRFLIILLVLVGVSLAIGFIAVKFELPIDVNLIGMFIQIEESLGQALSIGLIFLFLCLFIWLFSATKDMDGGIPKQMVKGDYDVNSDQKGSARWLTDKEIDTLSKISEI